MNGKASPLVGRSPVTTPMLNIAWKKMRNVTPKAMNFPRRSQDLTEIMTPHTKTVTKSVKRSNEKPIPHSSAPIANMKSVWFSGRYICFCMEFPNPTPVSPPLRMAINA